jgi:hypothetical protein
MPDFRDFAIEVTPGATRAGSVPTLSEFLAK